MIVYRCCCSKGIFFFFRFFFFLLPFREHESGTIFKEAVVQFIKVYGTTIVVKEKGNNGVPIGEIAPRDLHARKVGFIEKHFAHAVVWKGGGIKSFQNVFHGLVFFHHLFKTTVMGFQDFVRFLVPDSWNVEIVIGST